MSYLEELLPEFRKGAKIRHKSWDKDCYIQMNLADCLIYSYDGKIFELSAMDICDNHWEFYKAPEPDWDYIIKNKCLCAFWNKKCCEVLGFLKQRKAYNDGEFHMYFSLPGAMYTDCRPVRRDEVTFYEEREK